MASQKRGIPLERELKSKIHRLTAKLKNLKFQEPSGAGEKYNALGETLALYSQEYMVL